MSMRKYNQPWLKGINDTDYNDLKYLLIYVVALPFHIFDFPRIFKFCRIRHEHCGFSINFLKRNYGT